MRKQSCKNRLWLTHDPVAARELRELILSLLTTNMTAKATTSSPAEEQEDESEEENIDGGKFFQFHD